MTGGGSSATDGRICTVVFVLWYSCVLVPDTESTIRKVSSIAVPAVNTKLLESEDTFENEADEGVAKMSVEWIPPRYSTGFTMISAEGGADKVYVKT